MQSDLIIIGAGPGGYETAVRAAHEGLSVTIVEKQALGGTCLNAGCIPTKCLCRNAEVLDQIHQAEVYGIQTGQVAFSLPQAIARKNEVVEKLKAGIAQLMKTPGITLVEGEARFAGDHTIQVGDEQYTAPHIIIATGSVTRILPIEGADAPGVLTSTELLNLEELPQRLCIIGGGVIGMEFASIFHSFGTQVEVVEFCKEILPPFDRDLAKRLRTALKKKGIGFHTGAAARAIHPGTPMVVEYEEKGKVQSLETDLVLMAVGRGPNLQSLNLEEAGIAFTPKGIITDERMRTNVEGIYAVGDINGKCQLAHAATFQGYCALEDILQHEDNPYIHALQTIPAAVFTHPEAAMAGETEESLTAKGIAYTARKAFYRANGKALSMNAEEGLVKVLVDETDHILGAHILGEHASDLIHEISVLMTQGKTLTDLKHAVHAHPSLSEILLML